MEIVVASKHLAVDFTSALDVDGREHLIIISKATWRIPSQGQRPRPQAPQPIAPADIYVGKPGESAMLYGSDYIRFKPRCDVLFNAQAHVPDGEPVEELLVGWQVGPLKKGLRVHGRRTWRKRLGFVTLSDADPFAQMPLHYGLAFGGTLKYEHKGDQHSDALLENPAGVGWVGKHTKDAVDGLAAHCLCALDDTVRSPTGNHKPVAFSAIGRHWAPRKDFAGTYDEAWQRDVFPLLPRDFDEQYHQCAPQDQQMAFPVGGEEIVLRNMMAGRDDVRFKLPRLDTIVVHVVTADYETLQLRPVVDTLYFEPDEARFTAVWRTSTPLQRNIHEIRGIEVAAGRDSKLDELMDRISSCAGCGEELST